MGTRHKLMQTEETHNDRFYVYQITQNDVCVYIGKGCGFRLQRQIKKYGGNGSIIKSFKKEKDAYAFERKMIFEVKPSLNKYSGGNGAHAQKIRIFKDKWLREIEKVGTRKYAARILIHCEKVQPGICNPSLIGLIREVAYGNRI
jgi:hypothetical protein